MKANKLPNGDMLFYYPQSFRQIPRRGLWQTDSLGNTKKQLVAIEDYYKIMFVLF